MSIQTEPSSAFIGVEDGVLRILQVHFLLVNLEHKEQELKHKKGKSRDTHV